MPRKKKCPNGSCDFEYSKKIHLCPKCKALICEESEVDPPKSKNKKKVKENNGETVYLGDGIFSVKYWQLNRCFVKVNTVLCDRLDDSVNFCTKKECSDMRRLAVRNMEQLTCEHVETVKADLMAGTIKIR